eukprot:g7622.t1
MSHDNATNSAMERKTVDLKCYQAGPARKKRGGNDSVEKHRILRTAGPAMMDCPDCGRFVPASEWSLKGNMCPYCNRDPTQYNIADLQKKTRNRKD